MSGAFIVWAWTVPAKHNAASKGHDDAPRRFRKACFAVRSNEPNQHVSRMINFLSLADPKSMLQLLQRIAQ
jgi:hypothetical protein